MFGVIGWILFGLLVGALAKLLMPGRDPGGFIVTMLLGIAGALLGGFLGRALGWYGEGDSAGFLMSLRGAIVWLAIHRMAVGRRARVSVAGNSRRWPALFPLRSSDSTRRIGLDS